MSIERALELYSIWAPEGAAWSDWAKPVLFERAALTSPDEAPTATAAEVPAGIPALGERCALVVDLPGAEGVAAGLRLARAGYRPVPLYNSCPGSLAVVEVQAIARALAAAARELLELDLPPDAPPAFLIDFLRMSGNMKIAPGVLDNRWMVFPQDFPSGNALRAHGIQRALWLGPAQAEPDEDLGHVLLRWREQGLSLWRSGTGSPADRVPLEVRRPPRFKNMWQRWLCTLGLKRSSAGGFGSVVPQPGRSAGGGSFGAFA